MYTRKAVAYRKYVNVRGSHGVGVLGSPRLTVLAC